MLRWLGLSSETRAHISAPGIDVVLSGEPRKVRHLLKVVTSALEAAVSEEERLARIRLSTPSQVVRPSDLDEMDSPYAMPGLKPLGVGSEPTDASGPSPEPTYEIPGRSADRMRRQLQGQAEAPRRATPRAPSLAMGGFEPPTVLPVPDADETTPPPEDPDPERTAVEYRPDEKARAVIHDRPTIPESGPEETVQAPKHPSKRGS